MKLKHLTFIVVAAAAVACQSGGDNTVKSSLPLYANLNAPIEERVED
ncbi:MAG: hypothetical protein HUJ92_03675, partial [Bacteroidales bacterium]|nr:hypothetical protein [Bacteroidales bacterium]